MRERWAEAIEHAARVYWTEARLAQLTGGKRLAITPRDAPVLLRALGLVDEDARLPPNRVRKFLQVNHVVRVVEEAFATLRARHPVVRVIDAGCGRSYLTLLLAWMGKHAWRHPIDILGVDRNAAVIAECERRTEIAELADVVRYRAAPVEAIAEPAHAVVALHACDTATDDAIALGITVGAELIAVAPCCQAELARGWSALAAAGGEGAFAPIWGAPHLRREIAAHVTDALRTLLLRDAGYAVTAMEFVGAEHTKKNTLLRAWRDVGDPAARAAYDQLVAATGGVGIALQRSLAR